MAQTGNPNQWGDFWPPDELIKSDIESDNGYVCVDENGRVVGVFRFAVEEDPTYINIYDGAWEDESPYGVVHRIASDHSVKGVGTFCINWAYEKCGHIRIDTHGDNTVMQNLLKKLGFAYCGVIYVQKDPYPRRAYEKTDKEEKA